MSEFVGHNSLNTGNLECPKQNLLDGTYDLKCDLLKSYSWNLTEEESPDIFLMQETAINEFIEEQGVLRVDVKKYIQDLQSRPDPRTEIQVGLQKPAAI